MTHDQPSTRVWIGTSGYNYAEWKGSFYPEKMSSKKMLPYYAERLPTVEINYTFYRMPTEKLLLGWAAATPESFRFTLKAPRRITHDARLKNCDELTAVFCATAGTLGPRLAALLFQLPPSCKKDVGLLRAFLQTLAPGAKAAFEFRHLSWHDDHVYECLRTSGHALCVADSERLTTPVVMTAPHAYFRLRDEGYADTDIARWADTIRESTVSCDEVFVYFKHEDAGTGPAFARSLIDRLHAEDPLADSGHETSVKTLL